MARYDYRCTACGEVFEVEHSMTERPEVTCPSCGGAAEKVFSASGIKFEGSGFYNTDQREQLLRKRDRLLRLLSQRLVSRHLDMPRGPDCQIRHLCDQSSPQEGES